MNTMKQHGTSSYQWMLEGITPHEIAEIGVRQFIQTYVMNVISVVNNTDDDDEELYSRWLQTGEFEEIEAMINEWMPDAWTAVAYTHRSGAFTGQFGVIAGDPSEQDDPNWVMGNFYILGIYESKSHASACADAASQEYWGDD